jgi:hypothetical protein
MEAMMPAKILALVFVLLPSMAMADSQLPWFGSNASGNFRFAETTGSLASAKSLSQLKISANYRCSAESCMNPSNFTKAAPRAPASPQ